MFYGSLFASHLGPRDCMRKDGLPIVRSSLDPQPRTLPPVVAKYYPCNFVLETEHDAIY